MLLGVGWGWGGNYIHVQAVRYSGRKHIMWHWFPRLMGELWLCFRGLACVRFSVNWRKFVASDGKIFKPIRQPWRTKILGGSYRRLRDAVHGRKSHTLFVLLLLWLLTMCVGALLHTIISLKPVFQGLSSVLLIKMLLVHKVVFLGGFDNTTNKKSF